LKLSNHSVHASILSNTVELMIFVVVVISSYEEIKIISIPKGPVNWDKLGNDRYNKATNLDITNYMDYFSRLEFLLVEGLLCRLFVQQRVSPADIGT
jgi:hypothetical protein